ncbi:Fc.00g085010.m01.CDS01 [Cosmosporella sp. VM-42]
MPNPWRTRDIARFWIGCPQHASLSTTSGTLNADFKDRGSGYSTAGIIWIGNFPVPPLLFFSMSSNQASPSLLAYFYCSKNASEVELSDPKEIMRSITRQLGVTISAQKTIHSAIVNDYERREAEAKIEGFDVARLSLQDCIRMILSITGSDPVTIVIDAIDEVQPKSRYELVESLQQIVRDSASVVKIFVTSRDDDQVLSLLTNASALRIEAENNRQDMEGFVHDQVALAVNNRRLLTGNISSQLKADLSKALIEGAGEMYLVVWQIEKLCDMRHELDVQKAMRRFSDDTLDRLYSEILGKIRNVEEYSSTIATRAFSLLLSVHEPLSPASFIAALTLMGGNDENLLQLPQVLRICFHLITVDSKMNVLRFAHTSVQEFLEAQSEFAPHKTNVGLGAVLSPIAHFYQYGVLYWAQHCRTAFLTDNDPELLQLTMEFIFDEKETSLSFISWLEDAQDLGNLSIVKLFLDNNLVVDPSNEKSWVSYGSPEIPVECVSGGMANPIFPNVDKYHHLDERASPLNRACSKGHEDIARLLLERGADVQLEVEPRPLYVEGYRCKTPLQIAAYAGHLSVVQLLINAGAKINHFNARGTALSVASGKNQLKVVEELVSVGATIFGPFGRWNALAEACRSRCGVVTELLLDELPETLEEQACINALPAAASSEDDSILQMLLAQNIPVPASTLSQACAASLHSSISMLVQRGVDINGDDREHDRALQVASYRQKDATVDFLLEHGAGVNTLTPKYGSPLQATLEGIAASILGAPPEFSTSESESDQTAHRRFGYPRYGYLGAKDFAACEHIVGALLARGADANPAPRSFGNPIHLASLIGSVSIVQQLLDGGADLNSTSDHCGTALLAALEHGHEDVVKLLLREGINVSHVSPKRGTALHYACKKQNLRMVLLLLDYGADPDVICGSHGSPLTSSISNCLWSGDGRDRGSEVAETILNRGNYTQIAEQDLLIAIERIAPWNRYREACSESARSEDATKLPLYGEVVRLFLAHDQNLRVTESILVAAAEHMRSPGVDTLRLLLQRDGGIGVTEAMMEAIKDPEIMKVLLKHRPICLVTPEVVCNLFENYGSSGHISPFRQSSDECELIGLLLDHEKDMPITATVMETILETDTEYTSQQTQTLIESLFERNSELEVTEAAIKGARTTNVMKVLLKHAPNLKVTPEFFFAPARERLRSCGTERDRVLLLLAHDETARVPLSLAQTLPSFDWNTETYNYFNVLLDREPNLPLSSNILWVLFGYRTWEDERFEVEKQHLELFLRHKKLIEFTEDFRKALDEEQDLDSELMALSYKLEDKGESVPAGD